ncbi:MAG: hypothetical protein DHS20C02_16680 [Micavibrio sp.]|nr:MAG: hypothetical protein DHS20C02_16680 [Micavibrio sp.]
MVELALALILIGLLVTPFMHRYNLYVRVKTFDETQVAMGDAGIVPQAINDFVDANGRYPCPADRSLDEDANLHGKEICPPAGAPAPGACIGTGGGLCRTTGRDADGFGGADPILIGGVPYATLNIPVGASLDGWKNKILYAVSERMTDGSISPFDEEQGAITIQEQDGTDLSPTTAPGNGDQPYVLVSHGSNGIGAFTAGGKLVQACGGAINGREFENCNNDNIFETPGFAPPNAFGVIEGLRSLVPGPDYNDDLVTYLVFGLSGLWAYTVDPDHIHNDNEGNVGIGPNMDDPLVELDVIGIIKAEKVLAETYCDDANNDGVEDNCFPVGVIGGTGINCDGNGGMTGVSVNNSVCDLHLPVGAITGGPCAANEFANGISAGVITCAPRP